MPVAEPFWQYSEARAEEDIPPESASFRRDRTRSNHDGRSRRTTPPLACALDTARPSTPRPQKSERVDDDVCPEALKGYLPLVYKLVRQLSRRLPANVERDDLLAAGIFGLLDSIRRNGGSEGEAFASYARMRIRGAIVDELRAQDWLSRRAREAVTASGSEGTSFVPLHEMTPGEESTHLAHGEDPSEALVAHSERHALTSAIAKLPERERRVVGMYYFEGAKLKEIGAELGVSEPRVSQLHARALGRLRGMLSAA
ncbi:uncharacterized protein CMC5_025240 [Chondromyces crocatus]|uniref:RNA polymerase sigma factor n=2 Tax=Chondromyces crocatus TaxID=52 RepID=A0A0K1ECS4_CHOCO|nr:sigma-70 family RNA polymerase sigma factor [Chondromyces crocatus]AKT38378.1 uncharacterized protein CMC5_025240 [Chondromyces crocatus]